LNIPAIINCTFLKILNGKNSAAVQSDVQQTAYGRNEEVSSTAPVLFDAEFVDFANILQLTVKTITVHIYYPGTKFLKSLLNRQMLKCSNCNNRENR